MVCILITGSNFTAYTVWNLRELTLSMSVEHILACTRHVGHLNTKEHSTCDILWYCFEIITESQVLYIIYLICYTAESYVQVLQLIYNHV